MCVSKQPGIRIAENQNYNKRRFTSIILLMLNVSAEERMTYSTECGRSLDNRVLILVSKQTNTIVTNQKAIFHVSILIG